ncbi:hypothetical protein MKEN_01269400 [Mycena kentingensis (nom. inval.)]|nr:hypothetical protein MKEN_01269400 [Mycena kentingensis (nom. inval.)]
MPAFETLVFIRSTAPMLLGTQANWLLLGSLIVQVYRFYTSFPNERWWVKSLVYTLFLLEVGQTATTSHFAYDTLVSSWGDPRVFENLPWSSLAIPIFTGIISASVQIFYAWRIYCLKGGRLWAQLMSGSIVLLALAQCFAAIISDARFAMHPQIGEISRLMLGVKIWLVGSAACDILITIALLIILTEFRRNTPWKRLESVLNRLITHTIETGLITSVVAVANVILFILFPQTNLYQLPGFILGKLYTNVLLATLNARREANEAGTLNTGFWTDKGPSSGRPARQTLEFCNPRVENVPLDSLDRGSVQMTKGSIVAI